MKIAIIGGGLSGLICASMLEKKGYSPTIYERLPKLGGVLDSFKRKKILFDVGFHYSGALAPKQYLYEIMKELNLFESLELLPYDDIFDTIYVDDKVFKIAQGSTNFKLQLQNMFPNELKNIEVFFDKCYESSLISADPETFVKIDSRSLKDVLVDIEDKTLRKIFLHFTIFYTTVFYEEASFDFYAKVFINMLDGTRKVHGGGGAIIQALKNSLKKTTIQVRSEVTQIVQSDTGVKSLICKNKEVNFDAIISTVHPKTTMEMIDTSSKKLSRYKKHINDLEESPSFFSIFCLIDAKIESNLYFYGEQELVQYFFSNSLFVYY